MSKAWASWGPLPIAPEGWVFVLPLVAIAGMAALLGWWPLTGVGMGLAGAVAFFFRDPERQVPAIPEAVVAPADGRVLEITPQGEEQWRISIFLSVLDVHINRAPYGGEVRAVRYTPGQFLAAYRREAPRVNEANSVTIQSATAAFVVTQIAGVLARRIVCRVRPGDVLVKGQRYGLIRFGSRTELLLPRAAALAVRVGDRVRGGESILAFLKEPHRP